MDGVLGRFGAIVADGLRGGPQYAAPNVHGEERRERSVAFLDELRQWKTLLRAALPPGALAVAAAASASVGDGAAPRPADRDVDVTLWAYRHINTFLRETVG